MSEPQQQATSAQEFGTLFAIICLIAPLLAVAVVGGYGFFVWMFQLIAGPPTG